MVRGVRILPWFGPIWGAGADPVGGDPGSEGQPLEGGPPNDGRTPDLSTAQLLGGRHSAERLVLAAALLRAAGWSEDRIRREIYPPFIVVGPASWGDSWHAPRYGPGIVREHEGQDVLCRYGAEVLAPENGTIEFDTGLLGGRSARLFRPDGSYYYFAHFVDWNDERFSDGDEVHRGDVIGYCGDTGNATVSHVHFGWYRPDGVAIDPMRRMVSWLHEAEDDLPMKVKEAAAAATESLGPAEPSLDIVWALLDDPLSEAGVTSRRTTVSTESHEPLDLTPVFMFMVLLGVSARRSVRRPKLSRIPRPGGSTPAATTMWANRRSPFLS
ncbi:MAG TPA: M23 family metallopeptidase [Actinomycetota bacterium]|nr:M23 family metallopeptidase [Actinomycetota bacterium]